MKIRFYLDEDSMSRELIRALLARGIDVQSAIDVGRIEYPDDQQLAYAASQERTLYTGNIGDFSKLHREYMDSQRSHSGIVLVHRHKYPIGEQIRRLLKLTSAVSAEAMKDRLEFLSAWS